MNRIRIFGGAIGDRRLSTYSMGGRWNFCQKMSPLYEKFIKGDIFLQKFHRPPMCCKKRTRRDSRLRICFLQTSLSLDRARIGLLVVSRQGGTRMVIMLGGDAGAGPTPLKP